MVHAAEYLENSIEGVVGEGEGAGRRKVVVATENQRGAAGGLLGRTVSPGTRGGLCRRGTRVSVCSVCTVESNSCEKMSGGSITE